MIIVSIIPTFLIIIPLIIGILVVDYTGEVIGLKQSIANFNDNPIGNVILAGLMYADYSDEPEDPEVEKIVIELPENIEEPVISGILFFVFNSYYAGIWLGVHTAPVNIAVAVIMLTLTFFPYLWLWLSGLIYLLIVERKEIKSIIISGFRDTDLKNYCKELKQDIKLSIMNKIRRKINNA